MVGQMPVGAYIYVLGANTLKRQTCKQLKSAYRICT